MDLFYTVCTIHLATPRSAIKLKKPFSIMFTVFPVGSRLLNTVHSM
ncbi:hypothetical protein M5D96_004780 [Drosophila gunungcola]|uniref:Uncharacterized protein n=1 Tax=Drosophila gunungcola TaxID=103775 RepID=A0A9P9YVC0_9MUSC|nr:hypothetical protein M5D96_004780 [Drosophila gunungcola]